MTSELAFLAGTAATLGFIHTLIGPDHYLPFIVLARARKWSSLKTAVITILCGLGHILSSVLLGMAGIAIGAAVFQLEAIEAYRGDIAGWLLLIFGFTYFVWGLWRAFRSKDHGHPHEHTEGEAHVHLHSHLGEHAHVHADGARSMTPWVLFLVFVFGPCESLIPLIMYPAATSGGWVSVVMVAGIFGLVTVGTMLAVVLASVYGLSKLPFQGVERYSHALAGLAILLCAGAIMFLGL
jgi:sulfite exporter TauE/SafE